MNHKPSFALSNQILGIAICLFCSTITCSSAYAETSADRINQLRSMKAGDAETLTASKAIRELNKANDVTLIQSLTAMKGATPVGRNWLMGLANSLYRKSGATKTEELTTFLADSTQDSEARYLVFQWLTSHSEELRNNWLTKMTTDPSLELKFLAIENALKDTKLERSKLELLLDSARHHEQIVNIIAKLKEQGLTVDQSKHFGFLTQWKLIGPFDHVGTKNFDKVFPVESDWIAGSVKGTYDGKTEPVKWIEESTSSPEGLVDLAAIYSNEKGCIVYASTEFDSIKELDAEIRLGCINANKIWVNGKLAMFNEVYHADMRIDQYSEPVHLKAGKNRILVKVCQNEQKDPWAQRFAFQLRISDSTGKAILSKDR